MNPETRNEPATASRPASTAPPSAGRRLVFGLVLAASVLVLVELLSVAAFVLELNDKPYVRQDLDHLRDTVTAERVRWFGREGYDARTGWLPRPNTDRISELGDGTPITVHFDEFAARHDPAGGPIVAACYGDSFTYGSEVNDDQTWPHDLAVLLGGRVLNLGVPGYGPDQALWRLESRLPEGRTPMVVLAVYGGNIRRLVTMYRPFYTREPGNVKFKPMLLPDGDGYRASPNPLQRSETLDDYLRAFETAKAHGYWYRRNHDKPEPRFPYTLSLFRVAAYRLFRYDEPNLYEIDEGASRMRHVFRELAGLSEEHGFLGVVLFIPDPGALKARVEGREHSYANFLARMRADGELARLRFLDMLDVDFDEERFNVRPMAGHTSAYGNRIIADALRDVIRAERPGERP